MKCAPLSRGDSECVSLKYKVKSDYLYKTEADILQEFRGREGEAAKRSRNTRMCFGGSGLKIRVVKETRLMKERPERKEEYNLVFINQISNLLAKRGIRHTQ